MANGIRIAGGVEHSVLISGNGNNVTFVTHDGAAPGTRTTPITAAASPRPTYEFDRKPQKDALSRLFSAAGASVASLYGPSGQGQGLVAEYLFQALLRADRTQHRIRVSDSDWPRGATLEAGLGELCECLGRRWRVALPEPLPSTPAELLERLKRRGAEASSERLLVHHSILVPTRNDVQLVERYLETFWRPIFAQGSGIAIPTLVFDLHLATRGPLMRRLYRWLRLADEGAASAILRLLAEFARNSGALFAPAPELLPLSDDDLAVLYPHDLDADAEQVRLRARALYQATLGNFDAVVARLFPAEAI